MKRQPKFLAQFASGAFAIYKDRCIRISPANVVINENSPDFDTEEVGFISQIMVEHLNKDDEIIDKESIMVNLPEDHTIISAEQACDLIDEPITFAQAKSFFR